MSHPSTHEICHHTWLAEACHILVLLLSILTTWRAVLSEAVCCRSPSELLEAGAVGAAGVSMGRAASHMLDRHGPALQRGASHVMERSKADMSRATSHMASVLERAASRAMSASQHFERAASKCLDSLDRSKTGRNSLDLAMDEVLAGMAPKPPTHHAPSSPKPSAATRMSRFQMQAFAQTC